MSHPPRLELAILPQPTDTTCGATCLHAVYAYYGDERPLQEIIDEVQLVETGGTLAVLLACHALRNGYRATVYSYNLQIFDPVWFEEGVDLTAKLQARMQRKEDPRIQVAARAYQQFLELGGKVRFEELTPSLLRRYLEEGTPVLTGLSATYLYESARESDDREDDVGGDPVGHFVVLAEDDARTGEVLVADPLHDNPRYGSPYYRVGVHRLIGAILLGILTYDANLLIIEPRED